MKILYSLCFLLLSCAVSSSLLSQEINNKLVTYPRPHANCYWVKPGRFLAGEYPGCITQSAAQEKLDLYLNAGITCFVDLTEKGELKPYESILQQQAVGHGIKVKYIRMPMRDMGIPTKRYMAKILNTIDTELASGQNVYVHCWGGIGRTGTVVGSYLVHQGMTGDQALRQLASWWRTVAKSKSYPYSPQTKKQRDFVKQYQN